MKAIYLLFALLPFLASCMEGGSSKPVVVDPYIFSGAMAVQASGEEDVCHTEIGRMRVPAGFDALESSTWPEHMTEQQAGILADCLKKRN